jgi:hypothetical protein
MIEPTFENRLEQANNPNEIFKSFLALTLSRLGENKPIVGRELSDEISLFGRHYLRCISKKDIRDVFFGCGCEGRKQLIAGNYNQQSGLWEVNLGNFLVTSYEQKGISSTRSANLEPEPIILNMFANKSGFGCESQTDYPNMYSRFIARGNMLKYPELYRALANSPQAQKFQKYHKFCDGELVSDSHGAGYYCGTTMQYSIRQAVEDKIGLKGDSK